MNIIIEGCDKAGKSTICEDIRIALSSAKPVVIKLSKTSNGENFESRDVIARLYLELFALAQSPLNEDNLFLFDRSYPSELVYSEVKRGYDAMLDTRYLSIDHALADDQRTLLVYCETDIDVLKYRFKKDGEKYLNESEIEQILGRYEKFLKWTSLPFIRINSQTDRAENLATVRKFLRI